MIIETRRLSKDYGRIEAVRALNLRVPEGGISAFLGPNGHGKSTTIKMLLGIAHPTAGEGWVLGLPIDVPKASLEIRRRTGFVSEDKHSYAFMTVQQALDFTRSLYPSWRADRERELLREFDLPVDRNIKQLSKGMRTKLALVLALSRGVELLILDEPSEGLDPVVAEVMLQAVVRAASDGATIFFSSHQLSEAERIADHVFILRRGEVVVQGKLDDLRQRYRRVNAVFGGMPPVEQLGKGGIERMETDGNMLSALVNGDAVTVAERARALGAVSVDVHPVDLRELFLGKVQETREMIWYKAWLESRWRFLICFGLVALLVAADVYQADINMPRLGMKPDEFGRYVWKLYFTRFGLEWTLSVLILSMGGLLRERSMGTADYSLSLPVTRRMWMGVRGSMAVAQASVLAFVPVVVVPLTAQVIGRSYPFSEATKFSVLTLLTGVFILMVGMLYSSLFQGEYIGVALGVSTVFFTAVAVNPLVQRYPSLGFSNFEQYLDSSWYLTKEWPWPSVLVKLVIAAMLWELATRVVEKRDF